MFSEQEVGAEVPSGLYQIDDAAQEILEGRLSQTFYAKNLVHPPPQNKRSPNKACLKSLKGIMSNHVNMIKTHDQIILKHAKMHSHI